MLQSLGRSYSRYVAVQRWYSGNLGMSVIPYLNYKLGINSQWRNGLLLRAMSKKGIKRIRGRAFRAATRALGKEPPYIAKEFLSHFELLHLTGFSPLHSLRHVTYGECRRACGEKREMGG